MKTYGIPHGNAHVKYNNGESTCCVTNRNKMHSNVWSMNNLASKIFLVKLDDFEYVNTNHWQWFTL